MFEVICPFGSGELKYIFKMAALAGIFLGFLIEMMLRVLINKSRQYFVPNFTSFGLLAQKKKLKIHFQNGCHLRFWIGLILANFDLQVTQILVTNFGISWPFSSGELKYIFKMAALAAIFLGFRSEQISKF